MFSNHYSNTQNSKKAHTIKDEQFNYDDTENAIRKYPDLAMKIISDFIPGGGILIQEMYNSLASTPWLKRKNLVEHAVEMDLDIIDYKQARSTSRLSHEAYTHILAVKNDDRLKKYWPQYCLKAFEVVIKDSKKADANYEELITKYSNIPEIKKELENQQSINKELTNILEEAKNTITINAVDISELKKNSAQKDVKFDNLKQRIENVYNGMQENINKLSNNQDLQESILNKLELKFTEVSTKGFEFNNEIMYLEKELISEKKKLLDPDIKIRNQAQLKVFDLSSSLRIKIHEKHKEYESFKQSLQLASDGAVLISNIIRLTNKHDLANTISEYAHAGIATANAIGTLINFSAAVASSGPLAPYIATVGAINAVISLFQKKKESDLSIITKMFNKVFEQMHKYAEHFDKRFDNIEALIMQQHEFNVQSFQAIYSDVNEIKMNVDAIYKFMITIHKNLNLYFRDIVELGKDNHSKMVEIFQSVSNRIGTLQNSMNSVAKTVDKILDNTKKMSMESALNSYNERKNLVFGHSDIAHPDNKIPQYELDAAFTTFKNLALSTSSIPIFKGEYKSDMKNFDVSQEIKKQGVYYNIGLLVEYLNSHFENNLSKKQAFNPLIWAEGSLALTQLISQVYDFKIHNKQAYYLKKLVKKGDYFNDLVIDFKTNGHLYINLFNSYYSAYEQVKNKIFDTAKEHQKYFIDKLTDVHRARRSSLELKFDETTYSYLNELMDYLISCDFVGYFKGNIGTNSEMSFTRVDNHHKSSTFDDIKRWFDNNPYLAQKIVNIGWNGAVELLDSNQLKDLFKIIGYHIPQHNHEVKSFINNYYKDGSYEVYQMDKMSIAKHIERQVKTHLNNVENINIYEPINLDAKFPITTSHVLKNYRHQFALMLNWKEKTFPIIVNQNINIEDAYINRELYQLLTYAEALGLLTFEHHVAENDIKCAAPSHVKNTFNPHFSKMVTSIKYANGNDGDKLNTWLDLDFSLFYQLTFNPADDIKNRQMISFYPDFSLKEEEDKLISKLSNMIEEKVKNFYNDLNKELYNKLKCEHEKNQLVSALDELDAIKTIIEACAQIGSLPVGALWGRNEFINYLKNFDFNKSHSPVTDYFRNNFEEIFSNYKNTLLNIVSENKVSYSALTASKDQHADIDKIKREFAGNKLINYVIDHLKEIINLYYQKPNHQLVSAIKNYSDNKNKGSSKNDNIQQEKQQDAINTKCSDRVTNARSTSTVVNEESEEIKDGDIYETSADIEVVEAEPLTSSASRNVPYLVDFAANMVQTAKSWLIGDKKRYVDTIYSQGLTDLTLVRNSINEPISDMSCQSRYMNSHPVLKCDTPYQTTYVIPKSPQNTIAQNTTSSDMLFINGDNYHTSSCKPSSFYGQSSATCEGENTYLHFIPKPYQTLSSQLDSWTLILHVFIKQIQQWVNQSKNSNPNVESVKFDKETIHPLEKFYETKLAIYDLDLLEDDPFEVHLERMPEDVMNELSGLSNTLSKGIYPKGWETLKSDLQTVLYSWVEAYDRFKRVNAYLEYGNDKANQGKFFNNSRVSLGSYAIYNGTRVNFEIKPIAKDGWCTIRAAGFTSPREAVANLKNHLSNNLVVENISDAIYNNYESYKANAEPFVIKDRRLLDMFDQRHAYGKETFKAYTRHPDVQRRYLNDLLSCAYANYYIAAACLALEGKRLVVFADYNNQYFTNIFNEKENLYDDNIVIILFRGAEGQAHYDRLVPKRPLEKSLPSMAAWQQENSDKIISGSNYSNTQISKEVPTHDNRETVGNNLALTSRL